MGVEHSAPTNGGEAKASAAPGLEKSSMSGRWVRVSRKTRRAQIREREPILPMKLPHKLRGKDRKGEKNAQASSERWNGRGRVIRNKWLKRIQPQSPDILLPVSLQQFSDTTSGFPKAIKLI